MPPTQLYNEGWMLRLTLDRFVSLDLNREQHALAVSPGCRWYSEAYLPSAFLARWKGDLSLSRGRMRMASSVTSTSEPEPRATSLSARMPGISSFWKPRCSASWRQVLTRSLLQPGRTQCSLHRRSIEASREAGGRIRRTRFLRPGAGEPDCLWNIRRTVRQKLVMRPCRTESE